MPFNLQVSINEARHAQFSAPSSLPAKRLFFLDRQTGRMARSTLLLCVPCQGALLSPVEIRAGKLSLQPEALGAGQEATNGLKHFAWLQQKASVTEVSADLEPANFL